MAIIGRVEVDREDAWHERIWSGADITEVHCGEPAVVWVGFNTCAVHGAEHMAGIWSKVLYRATGRRWTEREIAEQEWYDHMWRTCERCLVASTVEERRACPEYRRLLNRHHRLESHQSRPKMRPDEVRVVNVKSGRSARLDKFLARGGKLGHRF